jgi:tetratricopeptide (TPR) repeat protein
MDKLDKILLKVNFLKKKNYLHAIQLLNDAILQFPDNYDLYFEAATIYSNHKFNRKALEMYSKALTIKPDNENIYFLMGNNFLALEEYQLAIDYFSKIRETYPELIYNKAYAYSKLGKIEISIDLMENLVENYSTSEIPYLFLSELHFLKKEYEMALKYLDDAERRFGRRGSFHYLKGAAFSHLENWLKAYIEFNEADKFHVDFPHFYRSYAISAEKIGHTEQAIDLLNKNLETEPDDPLTYIELIKIYIDHDELDKAQKLLQEAQPIVSLPFQFTVLYKQLIEKMRLK